jgi:hypothetical protein
MEPIESRALMCPVIKIDAENVLDGDEIYYALPSHAARDIIHGPFTAVLVPDNERLMLKNLNGGKFFLDAVSKIAVIYKRL